MEEPIANICQSGKKHSRFVRIHPNQFGKAHQAIPDPSPQTGDLAQKLPTNPDVKYALWRLFANEVLGLRDEDLGRARDAAWDWFDAGYES